MAKDSDGRLFPIVDWENFYLWGTQLDRNEPAMKKLRANLDSRLSALDLRSKADKLWSLLQNPVKVGDRAYVFFCSSGCYDNPNRDAT
jgi:hypothetical protein